MCEKFVSYYFKDYILTLLFYDCSKSEIYKIPSSSLYREKNYSFNHLKT